MMLFKKLKPSTSLKGLLVGLFFFVLALLWARSIHFKDTHIYICKVVADRSLFGADMSVEEWRHKCAEAAEEISVFTTPHQLIERLQSYFSEVGFSHLRLYTPIEDKRLWKGKAKETGLISWEINGRFVVAEVIKGSPAEALGVKRGDQILLAGGKAPMTRWQVRTAEGLYEFERQGEFYSVEIEPSEISIDQRPQIEEIKPGVGLLKISSYRAEYFESESWRSLSEKLNSYPRLVIDLRDNYGGNFVAMLRSLSPFFCQGEEIGRLHQPRRSDEGSAPFADNADDLYQISQIEKFKEIPLKTFETYGCYKGSVVTMINRRTSSVAEIFAHTMHSRKRSAVIGETSAGDVVLAIWYNLHQLGPGYSFSIPEAIFEDPEGTSLEGRGTTPDTVTFYNLDEALEGKDSWIETAVSILNRL